MFIYVCLSMCKFICIYIYVYADTRKICWRWTHKKRTSGLLYAYIYDVYLYIYMFIYVCLYMYVYMCICMYVYICVCIYKRDSSIRAHKKCKKMLILFLICIYISMNTFKYKLVCVYVYTCICIYKRWNHKNRKEYFSSVNLVYSMHIDVYTYLPPLIPVILIFLCTNISQYMYINTDMYTIIHISNLLTLIFIYRNMHIYIYTHIYVYICICLSICIYMYIYICIYIHIHISIYIYIYIRNISLNCSKLPMWTL
jgi:hypothetical protein